MDEVRNEEQQQTHGDAGFASDELADKVSAEFTDDQTPTTDLPGEQAEPVMLEEEKVKDEIDIQIDLLKDPDWVVRREAAITLGEMGDERCVEPLMVQLRSDEFKDDATNALVELGEPALDRLVKALKDKDETVRKQAVLALGRIKHTGAVDPLIEMLADADWFTRLTAAAALEAIGDLRGRDAIKPLTKDPDMVVRMRVERILVKWKKQPAGSVSMN